VSDLERWRLNSRLIRREVSKSNIFREGRMMEEKIRGREPHLGKEGWSNVDGLNPRGGSSNRAFPEHTKEELVQRAGRSDS